MPAFIAQMSLLDYLAFGAVAWLVIRGFLRGCSGDVRETALKWLAGTLADSGDCCHEHEHGCHHHA